MAVPSRTGRGIKIFNYSINWVEYDPGVDRWGGKGHVTGFNNTDKGIFTGLET